MMGDVLSGEISFDGPTIVLWKIPDFFTLLDEIDSELIDELVSPSFRRGNESWILKVSIDSSFFRPSEDWVTLEFKEEEYIGKSYVYECGLKKENGEFFYRVNRKDFHNDSASLASVDDFFKKKCEFAPNGHVIFFFEFRSEDGPLATRDMPRSSGTRAVEQPQQDSAEHLNSRCSHNMASNAECRDLDILSQHLKDLYLKGQQSDMTFKVGDRKFNAHKLILASRSTVLAEMIQHDEKKRECNSEQVYVVDCDADDFHQFLIYLYCGKVEKLSSENAVGLYTLADKYKVESLKTKCVEQLKKGLNEHTFFEVIRFVLKHDESVLLESAKEYFKINSKKTILTTEWLSFMKENTALAKELFLLVAPD